MQGKIKNVQISAESYAHLTETEAQVKVLNEKLSSAQSEITTKDSLVKQHARVAEEAIAGVFSPHLNNFMFHHHVYC